MLWDLQKIKASGAIVDVRAHASNLKPWGDGDAELPFEISQQELTWEEAEELREKALAAGGDGFNPPPGGE